MNDTAAETLFSPLTLPNGAVLPNRIAKAAMEENMADDDQLPGRALHTLYSRWARGGVGLILSGNVMIDPRAVTGPGGVVLDARQPIEPFVAWARAARSGGAHAWLQINHPGRQIYSSFGQEAVAPSAIAVEIPGHPGLFPVPRALEPAEIDAVVDRFAATAQMTEKAGFTGVQVHAAHGYLLSQFLSPISNRRRDAWGGTLENRARLLLDVVRAIRARVTPGFAVAVKLNAADFQKGGFEVADAARVMAWLGELSVDLVELSGGSYESPAMQGTPTSGSVSAADGYFVDLARQVARNARMPVMVTGGIRTRAVAASAVNPGDGRPAVAMVGIASALAFDPDLPARWRRGEALDVTVPRVRWKSPTASLANQAIVKVQLRRLGAGRATKPGVWPVLAMVLGLLRTKARTRRYRAWLDRRANAPTVPGLLVGAKLPSRTG